MEWLVGEGAENVVEHVSFLHLKKIKFTQTTDPNRPLNFTFQSESGLEALSTEQRACVWPGPSGNTARALGQPVFFFFFQLEFWGAGTPPWW